MSLELQGVKSGHVSWQGHAGFLLGVFFFLELPYQTWKITSGFE